MLLHRGVPEKLGKPFPPPNHNHGLCEALSIDKLSDAQRNVAAQVSTLTLVASPFKLA